eukprot:TRINITY_DN826_c0_g1_i3.p1 TRINITY_DN826_c0_g1~~TRINITY_DN826_c0_g1_i3.p1  ORF type:complete len:100 (+),score=35.56 TRINITY_DN826_c0_g1_i3:64-363(+)
MEDDQPVVLSKKEQAKLKKREDKKAQRNAEVEQGADWKQYDEKKGKQRENRRQNAKEATKKQSEEQERRRQATKETEEGGKKSRPAPPPNPMKCYLRGL